MRPNDRPRGATLLELLLALTLLGILALAGLLSLGRGLDAYLVRGAANSLAAGIARARAVAVARGGAALVVDVEEGRFWVTDAEGVRIGAEVSLERAHRVDLTADGHDRGRVRVPFDAFGIGRASSHTFRVRRGRAEYHVSLSSYGRVRLW